MHQNSDGDHEDATPRLPVARLMLGLSPGEPRTYADLVELDKEELQAAAGVSGALSNAGWTVRLAIEDSHVELIAEKRHAAVGAAIGELVALGVKTGVLYLDTPGREETTHEVVMDTPSQVMYLGGADPPHGRGTGQPLRDTALALQHALGDADADPEGIREMADELAGAVIELTLP